MNGNYTEKTILSAQMPVALRDELMRLAGEHDRSMSAEVRAAVRAYVSRADAASAVGVEDSSTGRAAMTTSSSRAPAGDAVPAGVESGEGAMEEALQ